MSIPYDLSANNFEGFVLLAKMQELRRQGAGLGHLSTRTLVERCAVALADPAFTSDDIGPIDEWAYLNCEKDAALFKAHAARYRKASSQSEEWDRRVFSDPALVEPLKNLMSCRSPEALELDNRRHGQYGLYDEDKAVKYGHFIKVHGTSAQKSRAMDKLLALESSKDAFAPEYVVTARNSETLSRQKPRRINRRDKARSRLADYEARIEGKSRSEVRQLQEQLAAAEGRPRKLFMKSIKEARDRREGVEARLAR